MKITAEWIHAHKTPRGAWTRKQLAVLGVEWPPERGWISRVEGHTITEEQRVAFVQESAAAQSRIAFDG